MKLDKLKDTLLKEKESLKQYIQGKLDSGQDWHAISDAANDLRDIDAKLEVIVLWEENLKEIGETAFNSLIAKNPININSPQNSLECMKIIKDYNEE